MRATRVSSADIYGYLSLAKEEGVIHGFDRIDTPGARGGLWRIQVPSTRYDQYKEIEWATIILKSREVCAFVEGWWAAKGRHPTNRAGASRAPWEQRHSSPNPFGR